MPYLPWERVGSFGPISLFRCRECGAVYLQVGGLKRRLTVVSCRSHIRDIDPTFERRRDARVECSLRASIASRATVLESRVLNLSRKGLKVETAEPLEGRVLVTIHPSNPGADCAPSDPRPECASPAGSAGAPGAPGSAGSAASPGASRSPVSMQAPVTVRARVIYSRRAGSAWHSGLITGRFPTREMPWK